MFEITRNDLEAFEYYKNEGYLNPEAEYAFTFEKRWLIVHQLIRNKTVYYAFDMKNKKSKKVSTEPKEYQLEDIREKLLPQILRALASTRPFPWETLDPIELIKTIFECVLPAYGFALRQEQVRLSIMIYEGFMGKTVSICEAEVGSGKTIAYLVAGFVANLMRESSGLRVQPVTIATSSVELQQAIVERDIPKLSHILMETGLTPKPLSAVLRKGKEHYFCLSRYMRYTSVRSTTGSPSRRSLPSIYDDQLVERAFDLDKSDLPGSVKERICVSGGCKKCKSRGWCRYIHFVDNALNVHSPLTFQVTNHNLYLMSKLRDNLLRESEFVVIDEAHKLKEPLTSGSASPVLRSSVAAVQQHLQHQKVIREAERKAHVSRAAKISAQIRKRAANSARKASKAAIDETKAMVSLVAGGGAIAMIIIVVVILFGCSFAMFGSGNGSSYIPVSAEVNAYEPLIRHYAAEHQIPEYVELIKAVMMQESGGRGNDPMQASECGYNQRFPRTPNGITDPEYSINVGVRELAECLRLAEVDSPLDMDRIRLALQGYNFGEGYISWAKAHGGYTALSAKEYSDMMAARNHWESYGDVNYVNHVLQYYPFGHAFLPGGDQMLVEVARSQLGNIGGDPYWSWYGFDSRVEWCACFVSWCCDQCGYIESGVVPKYSYCPTGADWFKERNQWAERDITPQPGMIIFFDWARGGRQDGETDHTGIVEKVEDGRVYTIEGNSGNACREKSYPIGWYEIYGYGVPAF